MRLDEVRSSTPARAESSGHHHLPPAVLAILASVGLLADEVRATPTSREDMRRDAVVEAAAFPTDDDADDDADDEPDNDAEEELAWSVALLAASDFDDLTLGVADIGLDWEIAEGLSAGIFGEVLYASQDPDDALGGGGGVTLRWCFHELDATSLFVDVGCGAVVFTERVPGDGSRFNFTPRVAFGARIALDDGAMLEARVGWFHVSNAQTADSNPGFDGAMVGIGLSFPF